jgi:hypothetical protein
MVDLMSKKQVLGLPFSKGGLDAFAPCNLKGKSRCRFAVGATGRHKADNHKSQDRSRGSEPHITAIIAPLAPL